MPDALSISDAPHSTAAAAAPPAGVLLLDVAGVAMALQVSERQVRRLVAGGDFGPMVLRLGRRCVRVRADELRSWTVAGCPPRSRWRWAPPESRAT